MYQIFIKDICTNKGGTYRIEITENTTMLEFKKNVFEKIKLPVELQKFKHNAKYLNDVDNIFEQIDFSENNWVIIELVFRSNPAFNIIK